MLWYFYEGVNGKIFDKNGEYKPSSTYHVIGICGVCKGKRLKKKDVDWWLKVCRVVFVDRSTKINLDLKYENN